MEYVLGLGFVALLACEIIIGYRQRNASRQPVPAEPHRLLARVDDVEIYLKRGASWGEGLLHLSMHRAQQKRLSSSRGPVLLRSHTALADISLKGPPLFEAALRGRWPVKDRVISGDAKLDAALVLGGDATHVAAALSAGARHCLLELFGEAIWAHDGSMQLGAMLLPDTEIAAVFPCLLLLAKSFSHRVTAADRKQALLQNLEDDPVPAVRHVNLSLLLAHFGADPTVLDMAHQALEDDDPMLRLLAASHAPSELANKAQATLSELLQRQHGPDIRAAALRALCRHPQQVQGLRAQLLALVRDPSPAVRTAAFEELAAHGWQPEQGTLALAPDEGGELSITEPEASATDSKS